MKMATLFKVALVASATLGSMAAQAELIPLSADGTPQSRSFEAGTYSIQFINGGPNFTAYSLRMDGGVPQQSFRTLSSFTIGSETTEFGFAIVPRPNGIGNMYAEYPTIGDALNAANNTPAGFSLTAPTDVTFRVVDNPYWDNSYGVLLSVSAVPEPSTYALMLAGLAMTGAVARRRRKAV